MNHTQLVKADKMYRQGATYEQVGNRFGFSMSQTRYHLHRFEGHEPRGRSRTKGKGPTAKSILQLDPVKKMRLEGKTYREIGEAFGVTHQMVDVFFLRYLPEMVHQKRKSRKDAAREKKEIERAKQDRVDAAKAIKAAAIEMYLDGYTTREILESSDGLNSHTLSSWLCEERANDPLFPSERGMDGRPYNWQARTIQVLKDSSTLGEAAKILGVTCGGLFVRRTRLRAKGINI